ncbi:FUSC family protein [Phycicoccus sp.]|uniref:FUSC family protein n=1 Tax=Phycicoccus sp. TaxID=1902410 RepID=UPI002BED69D6|nr:FUSC family protein [Phycicoccus sp.]HMM95483.1 FUSC family protein [Phycicoccus sp.]
MTRRPRPATVLSDVLQIAKAAGAAVLAWELADGVLALDDAFLAPWAALLTVHATVLRSVRRGVETIAAVALGLVLSFVAVLVLGADTVSLALAVGVGLALGRLPWLRHESVTAAVTALFVITLGETSSEGHAMAVLPDRFADSAIGVVVAVLVNLVVVPPLDQRSVNLQIDEVDRGIGALLVDIGEGLRTGWTAEDAGDWIDRTRSVDATLVHARSLLSFSDESRRWNPRRRRHPVTVPTSTGEVLDRLEEGVAQVRGIARHLREAARSSGVADAHFRERLGSLLGALGQRVAVPGASVGGLREELTDLATDLADAHLPARTWPLYGALLANTLTLVDVVDDVATAPGVRGRAVRSGT